MQDSDFQSGAQIFVIFTKLWKSSAIFHRRTMAMAAMDMVSKAGVSGVSFHLEKCSHWVASVLFKKTPHFWVSMLKVGPPDGSWLICFIANDLRKRLWLFIVAATKRLRILTYNTGCTSICSRMIGAGLIGQSRIYEWLSRWYGLWGGQCRFCICANDLVTAPSSVSERTNVASLACTYIRLT
jgi:hypothetical protein